MTAREISSPQAICGGRREAWRRREDRAYAVVGEEGELGDGCVLHAHAVVQDRRSSARAMCFMRSVWWEATPRTIRFRGERAELVVGDGNIFREYVTVSRGTQKGGGKTTLGNDNFF